MFNGFDHAGSIIEFVEDASNTLKNDGVVVMRKFADQEFIDQTLIELDDTSNIYSEAMVANKIFRKREDHPARKGDACMVTIGNPDTAPYLTISGNLEEMFAVYAVIVGELVSGISESSKFLMNWQEYEVGDNSLPYHMDVEIFNGDWGKYEINIDEGIIPRYVMVLVTENQNEGKGLKVMKDGVETALDLNAGDLVIFDNTIQLHGVPESTTLPRKMLGFRSFDVGTLYFNKDKFEGGTPFKNGFVEGFAKDLTVEEAQELLTKEGWYF